MKNSIIRLRIESEDKQIIAKARTKLKEEFSFNLQEPEFLRSAILSYCKDILSGVIKLKIERE